MRYRNKTKNILIPVGKLLGKLVLLQTIPLQKHFRCLNNNEHAVLRAAYLLTWLIWTLHTCKARLFQVVVICDNQWPWIRFLLELKERLITNGLDWPITICGQLTRGSGRAPAPGSHSRTRAWGRAYIRTRLEKWHWRLEVTVNFIRGCRFIILENNSQRKYFVYFCL